MAGSIPPTKYVRSGDGTSIAYQVLGEGPPDLVFVPGWVSHLDMDWEVGLGDFVKRLASFSRVIRFDKRGTGLSDRVPACGLPTLEERMDDVRAVMEAVGSERAALFAVSEGGPMCVLFAATYPQRTAALILYGSHATVGLPGDTGLRVRMVEGPGGLAEEVEAEWGEGFGFEYFAPSFSGVDGARELWARYQRAAASPAAAAATIRMSFASDVSEVLPSIHVPTLVLHRRGDQAVHVVYGRHLAAHIPDARYVELDGADHFWHVGDTESILAAIEEFLTGTAPVPATAERVLATVLFTDIVGSTDRAIELGDLGWRKLLDEHDALVRRQLERFRGREVNTTGDGFLASFDGPARAIHCACAVVDSAGALGIKLRAGLHTGECELRGDDLGGIAVHIAARVAALAGPGEVVVSGAVPPLVVGAPIEFVDRGGHPLKGVPGEWRLFSVLSA